MKIFLVYSMLLLSAIPHNHEFAELFQQASTSFENGNSSECKQILSHLSEIKINRNKRKKVAGLMVENSYIYEDKLNFISTLNSDFVKNNIDKTDYKNYLVLANAPSLRTTWAEKDVTIPLLSIGPKQAPLYGVSVSVNGQTCVGLIDNCCPDFCYATKSFAESNGITPLDYKLKINGKEDGFIGIADSLEIGGLTINNVLFIVSDVNKSLAKNYSFDIIIGSNVMRAVEDITINNANSTITFSQKGIECSRNIKLLSGSHTYYIDVLLNEEEISMLLDFGCSKTHLNSKYYKDRKEKIDNNCIESEIAFALVSHSETSKSFIIESGRFNISGSCCEMKNIHIQLSSRLSNRFDGSMGSDVLRHFNYVHFSASKLYIHLSQEIK